MCGFFDDTKRFMLGDLYIGRGSKQRNVTRSRFCNPYNVVHYGSNQAVSPFTQYLDDDISSRSEVWVETHQPLLGKREVPR